MAFSVQNDTGSIANANAYVTVAEFKAHQDDRGISYAAYVDADIEKAIVKATDYLDTRYTFEGYKRTSDQTTEFPRLEAPLTGIPKVLKKAAVLLAQRALGGATLLPDPTVDPRITSTTDKVGPIESTVNYSDRPTSGAPSYPDVDLLLRSAGLVASGISRRILRG